MSTKNPPTNTTAEVLRTLLEHGGPFYGHEAKALARAAAEIERLRAEIDRLRKIEDAARVQHDAYGAYPGLIEALS